MLEWFILLFVLTIFYIIMKTPKTPTKTPTPKAKTEPAFVAVASEAKTKKPSSTPKTPKQPPAATPKPAAKAKTEPPVALVVAVESPKKPSPAAKSPKKSQVVASKPVVASTEIAPSERVGLTAGSIWHYLVENGATPVAKLVRELPEEEKTIQRSIGWLAQEGKITLDTVDRVETIGLTG
jgi:hypothetical protein